MNQQQIEQQLSSLDTQALRMLRNTLTRVVEGLSESFDEWLPTMGLGKSEVALELRARIYHVLEGSKVLLSDISRPVLAAIEREIEQREQEMLDNMAKPPLPRVSIADVESGKTYVVFGHAASESAWWYGPLPEGSQVMIAPEVVEVDGQVLAENYNVAGYCIVAGATSYDTGTSAVSVVVVEGRE